MAYRSGRKTKRKGKHKRWIHGLCFGSYELKGVASGGGGEAYTWTYRRGSPTGRHRKGARKEYRQRLKKRLKEKGILYQHVNMKIPW